MFVNSPKLIADTLETWKPFKPPLKTYQFEPVDAEEEQGTDHVRH